MAVQIAAALQAEKLILMTDVPGVMRDKNDVGSLYRELNIRSCKELMAEGIVYGGMTPKVNQTRLTLCGVPQCLLPNRSPMCFLRFAGGVLHPLPRSGCAGSTHCGWQAGAFPPPGAAYRRGCWDHDHRLKLLGGENPLASAFAGFWKHVAFLLAF